MCRSRWKSKIKILKNSIYDNNNLYSTIYIVLLHYNILQKW